MSGGSSLLERQTDDFSLVLVVARNMVDDLLTRGLIGRDAIDPSPEPNGHRDSSVDAGIHLRQGVPRLVAHFPGVFVSGGRKIERDLAETGYFLLPKIECRTLIHRDTDGDLKSGTRTVIRDGDREPHLVGLELPGVLDDVAFESKLSFGDATRGLCYLICLVCEAIRFGGFSDCLRAGLVRSLGRLVRLAGLYDGGDGPCEADDGGDDDAEGGPVDSHTQTLEEVTA